MRIPSLARHAGLYIAAPVAQRAVHFALLPVFTHYLSPADYGAWGYLLVAGACIGTFAPLGLTGSFALALRRPGAWRTPAEAVRSSALKASWLAVAVTAAAAYPLLRQVDLKTAESDALWLLVLGATMAGHLVAVAKRRYQLLESPVRFAALELGVGFTAALGSWAGVVLLGWGVRGLAAGMALGAGVGLVPALWSVRGELAPPVRADALREALRYGWPLCFHAGAAIVLQYADRFMLERLSDLHQLGLYSLSGQLAAAMSLIATSTNQAYLPFLFRHADLRPQLVARAQRHVALFFAAAGLAGVLLVDPFIRWLVAPEFAASRLPAQLLIVGGVFHGLYYLALGHLLVRKQTLSVALWTAACALLNVGLNFWWIPRWQALGAAWATLAAEICLCVCLWRLARGALRQPTADETAALSPGALET